MQIESQNREQRKPFTLSLREVDLVRHVFREYSERKGFELSANTLRLINRLYAYLFYIDKGHLPFERHGL